MAVPRNSITTVLIDLIIRLSIFYIKHVNIRNIW
jgi:hypothetical protein